MTIIPKHRRNDWDTTLKEVQRNYPGIEDTDWFQAINDLNKLAAILKEILPADANSLDPASEYTTLPFHEALQNIRTARKYSTKGLADRINVSTGQAHRYLNGDTLPKAVDMAAIAVALKKPETFFREYRSLMLGAAVAKAMDDNPDRSAALIKSLVK